MKLKILFFIGKIQSNKVNGYSLRFNQLYHLYRYKVMNKIPKFDG